MGTYFVKNHAVPEPQAATQWFTYAGDHGIEISRAINIWEDAATDEGAKSRDIVERAGIHIESGVK
ncbi:MULTISPECIES: hypothetical protein [Paraburkholderia]|uniref:hypothetical protein n=1 Tax=Paraburkholderia TaxID=1822464 RepID=UPI002253A04F|nr:MULTISPECIES: hypothetical protein [Paraburkholderia]MCX4164523.1 hypothetical protein [Paraburkholderia megapolitana]MDN7160016.1 hypothetical protein [Paraburkholderia sp. CHISQ3]MDQ6497063.1 hypothetical protein [Paraburkholderia megapolitana]